MYSLTSNDRILVIAFSKPIVAVVSFHSTNKCSIKIVYFNFYMVGYTSSEIMI